MAKEADVAIFVGSSFRDPDILDVCRQCAARVPTFVVSRSGVFGDVRLPDSAKIITQCASMFIISTLPKFLRNGDVAELERMTAEETAQSDSIIEWLAQALDEKSDASDVCSSIENLVDRGVSVDLADLSRLLEHDIKAVREFAVALIQGSVDQAEAMEIGEKLSSESPEASFATEFRLLKELFSRSTA